MHSCSQPWFWVSHSSTSFMNTAEKPAFCTDVSDTNFTYIELPLDLQRDGEQKQSSFVLKGGARRKDWRLFSGTYFMFGGGL